MTFDRHSDAHLMSNVGPDGKIRCVMCGGPLTGRQERWCSQECIAEHLVRKGDSTVVRRKVHERDHGACAICQRDTEEPERAWRDAHDALRAKSAEYTDAGVPYSWIGGGSHVHPKHIIDNPPHPARARLYKLEQEIDTAWWWFLQAARAQGLCRRTGYPTQIFLSDGEVVPVKLYDHVWWDADHVVPVAEGGGGCGLDGYRTLCIPCHRSETAALRKRLAARKS